TGAIHLYIGVRAQDGGRQNDAEADDGAHVERARGVEQDSAGGDVRGFGEVFMRVRCANRDGKSEGKAYRTSRVGRPGAGQGNLGFFHSITSWVRLHRASESPKITLVFATHRKDMRLRHWPKNPLRIGLLQ